MAEAIACGVVTAVLAGIANGAVIAVDSAPIIYFLEDHAIFGRRYAPYFGAAEAGEISIVISTITLAEVLSGPLRNGNELLAAQYKEALTGAPGWRVVPIDVELAVSAARIRGRYKLRLPDAMQVATAIASGAQALLTNDRALSKIKEIEIIGLH
jgi:predicted nucleic acid-binding protein